MAKRRAHGECGFGEEGGCEVVVGASCGGGARGVVVGKGRGVGRMGRMEVSLVMWLIGLLVMKFFFVNVCFAVRLLRL